MKQEQIQELLSVSVEGVNYLAQAAGVHDGVVKDILTSLRQVTVLLEKEIKEAEGLFRQIYLYAKNIQASLDDLNQRPDLYERIVCMELRPFVLEMQRLWELGTKILPSAERRTAYRTQIMDQAEALHHTTPQDFCYDVSILLLAYNKLEYTKLAMESILAETDFSLGNIQLILLNNGSDDGTRAYFESIPNASVMNLRHNILGTCAYAHVLEGKYFVSFSNDVVATPRWLEHLYACMESDDRIGMAVPTCNEGSISNEQGISVPYPNTFDGMAEMQAFAEDYNHLKPVLWEERSQLMPFLAILRSEMLCLCAADPVYTRSEFVDDDLSTLMRRNGWRQILLKDTFMHHFGGVTLSEDRQSRKNNALDEMRRIYYEKWGVDAWDSRGGFIGMEHVPSWHTFGIDEHVLVLEPRFGDLACKLVNEYRRGGFVPHMTAMVFDRRYLPDTGYLFDEVLTAAGIQDAVSQAAGKYNIISAGCYLDELPLGDVIADLERLYELLAPGGMLLLPVRNPGSAYDILNLTYHGRYDCCESSGQVHMVSRVSYEALFDALKQHPFLKNFRGRYMCFEEDEEKGRALTTLFHSATADLDSVRQRLAVRMIFLGIFKDAGEAFLHARE